MSEARLPNVTADGSPGHMDLNYHEGRLQDALLLMETGRIGQASEMLRLALTHVEYYTKRRPVIAALDLHSRLTLRAVGTRRH